MQLKKILWTFHKEHPWLGYTEASIMYMYVKLYAYALWSHNIKSVFTFALNICPKLHLVVAASPYWIKMISFKVKNLFFFPFKILAHGIKIIFKISDMLIFLKPEGNQVKRKR